MALFRILPCWVATLLILGHAASGSDNFGVASTRHVSVRRGHTVTLPCWLTPAQSVDALEVLWYHNNNLDLSLIRYKDKEVSRHPSYDGRVSFGDSGVVSGGLALGDVSLELVNVTLQDSGEYTCYVTSDQNHDSASVTLAVTETGRPLRLSAVWTDNNVVNVSCGSEGWYPKPYLRWSDQNGALTPESVQHGNDSPGLLSVHSWLLVRSSSDIICTVGLQGGEEKESTLHLSQLPQTGQRASHNSASATAGLAALAVLLALVTTLLGIAFYKMREKNKKSQRETWKDKDMEDVPEGQMLLPNDMIITDMFTAKKNYVNISISIPESKHRFLSMKDTPNAYILREKNVFAQGSKVSCLTAIAGTPGFSSGEHYWEVSVGDDRGEVGLKRSWWLGVTNVCTIPDNEDFSPTASKGYWFLSSSSENPDFFQLNTEPAAWLPVPSKPQTVGVYLNWDTGEVTFYNVQTSSIIGSLKARFKGQVFPFFNPGLFDTAPLRILQNNTSEPCLPGTEGTAAPQPETP